MTEHTYGRDMVRLDEELNAGPFSERDRREIHETMLEAIGYARGRMDATQDHNLPWGGMDPLDFGASFARHVASARRAYRVGYGSTLRKDIRSAWDVFVVDGRVS